MKRIPISKASQGLAAGVLALSLMACGAGSLLALPSLSLQDNSAQPAAAAPRPPRRRPALATQSPVTTSMDQLLEDLYARANPSVVNITVVEGSAGGFGSGGGQGQLPTPQAPGSGSGFSMAQGSGFVYDDPGPHRHQQPRG